MDKGPDSDELNIVNKNIVSINQEKNITQIELTAAYKEIAFQRYWPYIR